MMVSLDLDPSEGYDQRTCMMALLPLPLVPETSVTCDLHAT